MTPFFYTWAENLSRYVNLHCLVSGVVQLFSRPNGGGSQKLC